MAIQRLPVVDSDDGVWGSILNAYLRVAHDSVGGLNVVSLSGAGAGNLDGEFPNPDDGQTVIIKGEDKIVRWNDTLSVWQDLIVGGGKPVGVANEVQFRDTGTGDFQFNTGFVWDNVNDRLGVNQSTPEEAVDIDGNIRTTGYTDIAEIATPSDPTADFARLYAKDKNTKTTLYYKDSLGDDSEIAIETVLVNQAAHGFVVGSLIVKNAATFALALADTLSNAQVVGIITEVIDVDNFRYLHKRGRVTLTTAQWDIVTGLVGGLVVGQMYYLSDTIAGGSADSKPLISKAVFTAISSTEAIFYNYPTEAAGEILSVENETKLTSASAVEDSFLGNPVAISGDDVVGGAIGQGVAGSAIVFRSGVEYILDGAAVGAVSGDQFGTAVAISGDVVVVGAYQDDDGGGNRGAVYVYRWNGSSYTMEQKIQAVTDPGSNDYFGDSVSISGNYIAVGARGYDGTNGGAGHPSSQKGSVYVFEYTATWGEVFHMIPPVNEDTDALGRYDSISIDSSRNVVIGDYQYDDGVGNIGCALVYRWNGATYDGYILTLPVGDRDGSDSLGRSVAIDGDYVIVGAPEDELEGGSLSNYGRAFIYKYSGSGYDLIHTHQKAFPREGEGFGYSVSVSGDYFAIGYESSNRVTVLKRITDSSFDVLDVRTTLSVGTSYFGRYVAMDSNKLAVAAYQDDAAANDGGALYTYDIEYSTVASGVIPVLTESDMVPTANAVIDAMNDNNSGFIATGGVIRQKRSSNVLIGGTAQYPSARLHVRGTALIENDTNTIGASANLYFRIDSSDNSRMKGGLLFERTATDGEGILHLANRDGSDTSNVDLTNSRLSILPDGNVGIGTVSPDFRLQVNGTIAPETSGQSLGDSLLRWDSFQGVSDTNEMTVNDILVAPKKAAAPVAPVSGQIYYDTVTNKLRVYNGTVWDDMN